MNPGLLVCRDRVADHVTVENCSRGHIHEDPGQLIGVNRVAGNALRQHVAGRRHFCKGDPVATSAIRAIPDASDQTEAVGVNHGNFVRAIRGRVAKHACDADFVSCHQSMRERRYDDIRRITGVSDNIPNPCSESGRRVVDSVANCAIQGKRVCVNHRNCLDSVRGSIAGDVTNPHALAGCQPMFGRCDLDRTRIGGSANGSLRNSVLHIDGHQSATRSVWLKFRNVPRTTRRDITHTNCGAIHRIQAKFVVINAGYRVQTIARIIDRGIIIHQTLKDDLSTGRQTVIG